MISKRAACGPPRLVEKKRADSLSPEHSNRDIPAIMKRTPYAQNTGSVSMPTGMISWLRGAQSNFRKCGMLLPVLLSQCGGAVALSCKAGVRSNSMACESEGNRMTATRNWLPKRSRGDKRI